MDVSYKATAVPRRWALSIYLTLASLIFLGILSQGLLIGALLFAGANWAGGAHTLGGLVVLILTRLLPLAGLLARLPRRLTILSAVLFVLTLIQVILPSSPLLNCKRPSAGRVAQNCSYKHLKGTVFATCENRFW